MNQEAGSHQTYLLHLGLPSLQNYLMLAHYSLQCLTDHYEGASPTPFS